MSINENAVLTVYKFAYQITIREQLGYLEIILWDKFSKKNGDVYLYQIQLALLGYLQKQFVLNLHHSLYLIQLTDLTYHQKFLLNYLFDFVIV